jgi:HSP20 family protein
MAGLQLVDPFENFEDAFKSFWRPVRFEMTAPAPSIKLEVSENDTAFSVKAQIPGAKKEDIKVKIDGDVVSITAESKQEKEEKKNGKVIKSEFQYGSAQRSFSLGTELDSGKSEARYQDGVLELTLPKKAGAKEISLAIK